jgi:CubicO group peptidase (beta-lactamase class C family)
MKIRLNWFVWGMIAGLIGLTSCNLTTEQKVDRLFRDYQGDDIPGAALMLIREGQPLLVRTYGYADLSTGERVNPRTNFRLASVSKQFTAMAIMILQERGAVDYENSLQTIFPEFPDYGRTISVRQLLQHTSGLVDYEDLIPDTATRQVLDHDVLELMMTQDSTYFPPGTAYRYSNSGYAVLAMVVEQLSGKSFASFLKDEIFTPLEMQNTVAFEKGISTVPERALGYRVEDDSVRFSDQSLTSAVLGDGGIYSSLEDLFRWDQALYTDRLISRASLERAFTPGLENYGFGWRIDAYRGHRRIHHTGSTCGFRTVIQRFPEDRFTVIILTNRAEPDVAPLAEKLVDWYLIKS